VAAPRFRFYSPSDSRAAVIGIPYRILAAHKSDLYCWREIFQVYVESDVFGSIRTETLGTITVENAEKRLSQFIERLTSRGLGGGRKLKLKQSRSALKLFLTLNIYILNVKKVSCQFLIL